MATPPNFVASYVSGYSQNTTPLTFTFDTSVGDVLVVKGAAEDGIYTLNTPTGGTGLIWTLQQSYTAANDAAVFVWTAIASAINTGATLSVTRSNNCWAGIGMTRYSGSGGIGLSNKAQSVTGTPSVAVTCSDNSALEFLVGDWVAVDGTTRTWLTINSITPTVGNGFELGYDRDASFGSSYRARWNDVGAAGSKTAGLSAPSGMQWSAIAIEILGATGSSFTQTPTEAAGNVDAGLLTFGRTPTDDSGTSDTIFMPLVGESLTWTIKLR
jgi:hypothetical protein